MKKLCILIAMTIFSLVGWQLGSGYGVFIAFLLSSIASMVGVYVGWRIYRDYFK